MSFVGRSRGTFRLGLFSASEVFLVLALLVTPHFGTFYPTQAAAQTLADTQFSDGKTRVNHAATLRPLTEAIASASCRVMSGVGPETARLDLSSSRQHFDKIITGLAEGDPLLGMPAAEARTRTRALLESTQTLWSPINEAADRLVSKDGSEIDAKIIDTGISLLAEQTKQAASVIAGQYANPQQLLQSDANVLNFAVRQQYLAHRMAHIMCELSAGTAPSSAQNELATVVDMFHQTLLALRDGHAAAGINPAPNDHIYQSLSATLEFWSAQREVFDGALAGVVPTQQEAVTAALLAEALAVAMDDTVSLYLIATPGQDDVFRLPVAAYVNSHLRGWISDPDLIAAIKAQNTDNANLTEDEIRELDAAWRHEVGEGDGPLVRAALSSPASAWLRTQQDAAQGIVTHVYVMDNRGLNVAQSAITADYWQGDEPKWKKTYAVGPDAMHISEVAFDALSGAYQAHASLSVVDPETGNVIGAATFRINVQRLM